MKAPREAAIAAKSTAGRRVKTPASVLWPATTVAGYSLSGGGRESDPSGGFRPHTDPKPSGVPGEGPAPDMRAREQASPNGHRGEDRVRRPRRTWKEALFSQAGVCLGERRVPESPVRAAHLRPCLGRGADDGSRIPQVLESRLVARDAIPLRFCGLSSYGTTSALDALGAGRRSRPRAPCKDARSRERWIAEAKGQLTCDEARPRSSC